METIALTEGLIEYMKELNQLEVEVTRFKLEINPIFRPAFTNSIEEGAKKLTKELSALISLIQIHRNLIEQLIMKY